MARQAEAATRAANNEVVNNISSSGGGGSSGVGSGAKRVRLGMVVGAGVGARVGESCGAVGKGEALEQRVEGGGNDWRGVGKSGEEGVEKSLGVWVTVSGGALGEVA